MAILAEWMGELVTLSFGSELPRPLGHTGNDHGRVAPPVGPPLFFHIAGLTVAVTAETPMGDDTFGSKFRSFQGLEPIGEVVHLHHHVGVPSVDTRKLGEKVLERVPWAVYRGDDSWTYLGIPPREGGPLHRAAVFSNDHMRARIYSPLPSGEAFTRGRFESLSLFPTDEIVLGRVLAGLQGCYVHSSAVVVNGRGLLFVGHSGAGKSTVARLVGSAGEILCDDRNIVRRWPDGFRVHGTWSHGKVPDVSSASAPLAAILFLRQASGNRLIKLNAHARGAALATCIVRPLVTGDWWRQILGLVELAAKEVPCYALEFDKSGRVVPLLTDLVAGGPASVRGRERAGPGLPA